MMGRFAALSGVENSEGKCLDGDIYLISGEMMGLGHDGGWRLNKCSAPLAWPRGKEGPL